MKNHRVRWGTGAALSALAGAAIALTGSTGADAADHDALKLGPTGRPARRSGNRRMVPSARKPDVENRGGPMRRIFAVAVTTVAVFAGLFVPSAAPAGAVIEVSKAEIGRAHV